MSNSYSIYNLSARKDENYNSRKGIQSTPFNYCLTNFIYEVRSRFPVLSVYKWQCNSPVISLLINESEILQMWQKHSLKLEPEKGSCFTRNEEVKLAESLIADFYLMEIVGNHFDFDELIKK